ncbi:MAG: AtpZ/AtpI family protein [Segetibacter sp.]
MQNNKPNIENKKATKGNDRLLLRYLGFGTQIMVSLALAVFVGLKLDKWLSFSTPLLVWILPLLILTVMIWQVIKDTSKK